MDTKDLKKTVNEHLKDKQKKIILIEIRSIYEFFGLRPSELTDDDIKTSANDLYKLLFEAAFTMPELVKVNRLYSLLKSLSDKMMMPFFFRNEKLKQ